MKRFLATSPRQKVTGDLIYEPVECEYLRYDKPNCFPILCVMNACLEAGDEAELIVITAKDDSGTLDKDGNPADYWCGLNFDLLSREAAALACEKGASLKTTRLEIPFRETTSSHLDNFRRLIRLFHTDDQVYADVTYGSKPGLMPLWIALNFAQKNVDDLSVETIVYGLRLHGTDRQELYDVTRLFIMDQIVSQLGAMNTADPAAVIEKLLAL